MTAWYPPKLHNFLWICYDIPVLSKEDVVSLIVESDDSTCPKLWIMRKQHCQHACYGVAKACSKIVKYHLRITLCHVNTSL